MGTKNVHMQQIEELSSIPSKDVSLLRSLAERYRSLLDPKRDLTLAGLWRDLNDRKPQRPMVWIDEIPWHELGGSGELTSSCCDPIARSWEDSLRKGIYAMKHFPLDAIPSSFFPLPKLYSGGRFALEVQERTLGGQHADEITSHEYVSQITDEADVEAVVQLPPAVYHRNESLALLEQARRIFDEVIPVELSGIRHIWYTPWDNLIQVWGVQQALMDLILRPELVHHALGRYQQQALAVLDSLEAEGLLSDGSGNHRVGSGGYGYISGLPDNGGRSDGCSSSRMWGCSNAQIFSDVSSPMHWDLALAYDIPWFERWGANYYGCCEPLDTKAELLERIPNLRKVSFSPWSDPVNGSRVLGDSVVYSCKPNPAVFAFDTFDEAAAEEELHRVLTPLVSDGCAVEIILKDISTVRGEPDRLSRWAAMASRVVQQYRY